MTAREWRERFIGVQKVFNGEAASGTDLSPQASKMAC